MNTSSKLLELTTKYFDSIIYAELDDKWVEEVICNEFTDAEESNITLDILFIDEALTILNKLAEICNAWSKSSTVDESTVNEQSGGLWTILDRMNINVKHILSIIYLLSTRAKKSLSPEKRKLGLVSAKLYFNILKVPGSGAYSIYHPNLFQLCIDCVPILDFTDKETSVDAFDDIFLLYTSTLLSLIYILKNFHLGDDPNTVEHAIKKLVELAAFEIQNHIDFNIDILNLTEKEMRRNFKTTHIISALAYQAFLSLLDTDLNGDKDKNYSVILSYLSQHILCYRARKNPTITQKHLLIKDNAVAFVCHSLETKEFASEITVTSLKRLCLAVNERTEFRATVSAAVVTMLFVLKKEHIAEMIQWILMLCDSAESKDRILAVDVLGHLLNNTKQVDSSDLPHSLQVYFTEVPIIFAILTRCDDTSPGVRTKALTVVSQNMKNILKFMADTKGQDNFDMELNEEISEKDLEVNGNHRFFWYQKSFRERMNEIECILHRRIEDNNVTARKAALLALENLVVFDPTYLSEKNLKCFSHAAQDSLVVIKKQMIQSLSFVLCSYSDNIDVQKCWLKSIFPLLNDGESSVKEKVLAVMEEQFLQKVFSVVQADRECTFSLLQILISGDFLPYQTFLKKAFKCWEDKLQPDILIHFEKYFETEWEESVWFYLMNFAAYSPVPSEILHLCFQRFEKYHRSEQYPTYMNFIFITLLNIFQDLASEQLEVIQNIVCDNLKSLTAPMSITHLYVELLYKIYKFTERESEFFDFCSALIQQLEEFLLKIKSEHFNGQPPSEHEIAKRFCIIKELCMIHPSYITPNVISLLKAFSGCDKPSKELSRILTPSLRAHTFAALGKICLQDELLAKDVLPVYAKELLTSKDDIIRNNVVVILIDMCKRYTSLADSYVPLICQCFKDRRYLIRYQTIMLIMNLLQEDYIKWKGILFFCLLSTVNDKNESIQELGKSCLLLSAQKHVTSFVEHFADCILVFNNFAPPDNERVAQAVKEFERFVLKGENRREERMNLFKFLIVSMNMVSRANLVKAVCDVITNVAEAVYPLNETTETIVRDCFAILTCSEIRAISVDQVNAEWDEALEKEICMNEISSRRIIIVQPVIPVIISLKNFIMTSETSLVQDLIVFLKDLLLDYKDNLKELLADDKILLRQVELEMKNEAEREKAEKRSSEKGASAINSEKEAVPTQEITVQSIQSMMNASKYLISGKEEDKNNEKEPAPVFDMTPRAGPSRSGNQKRNTQNRSPNNPSSNVSSCPPVTYNINAATPSEASDIYRFASTPRVVLTPVRIPKSSNILNVSAIEKAGGTRMLEDSDEDIL